MIATSVAAALALALAGCASRSQGDARGEVVHLQVHLDRAFTRHLQNHAWTFGATASGAYGVPMASGVGVGFTTTTASLIGGAEPGGAEIFLHDLSWGDQRFTELLTPGRSLYLSVLVEGGHRGLIALGRIIVPPSQHALIGIRLAQDGARMVVAPPTTMIMASDREAAFEDAAAAARGPDVGSSGAPPAPRSVGAGSEPAPASGPPPAGRRLVVSAGMRRYRVRTALQASLVGDPGTAVLDLDALLPGLAGAPTRLDVGAGHGEFIAALASAHPQERHLAVEHDPLRVTKIAHKCVRAGAANVRVFADEAHGFVRERVPPGALHRLYVLFPDPWPKLSHRRRRLLTRSFLIDCAWALAPGGQLIMASDVIEYVMSCLSQLTTIAECWRNLLGTSGCAFAAHSRYPTLFEQHGAREGRHAAHLRIERTTHPAPPRVDWRGRQGPAGYTPPIDDLA